MRRVALPFASSLMLVSMAAAAAAPALPEPSLVSFFSGALVGQSPGEYGGGWQTMYMFDGQPGTGWAGPEGVLTPAVAVVSLPERPLLERLEFATRGTDGENRGAKDVLVEVSDTEEWSPVYSALGTYTRLTMLLGAPWRNAKRVFLG